MKVNRSGSINDESTTINNYTSTNVVQDMKSRLKFKESGLNWGQRKSEKWRENPDYCTKWVINGVWL